jgi:hypothetical protein
MALALLLGGHALEHVDLVLVHRHGAVGLGNGEAGIRLLGPVTGKDGVADLLHWNCSSASSWWGDRAPSGTVCLRTYWRVCRVVTG